MVGRIEELMKEHGWENRRINEGACVSGACRCVCVCEVLRRGGG